MSKERISEIIAVANERKMPDGFTVRSKKE